jgi:hypothetical protein
MNFREGDFEKMGELFPQLDPSVAIRQLISAFVDKNHNQQHKPIETDVDL